MRSRMGRLVQALGEELDEAKGWIGVDLDATLAEYHGYPGAGIIGEPVPAMVERVKRWLAAGKDVRIFTARVSGEDVEKERAAIKAWCREHLGKELPVTNVKDADMVVLYDDRAVRVEKNTGRLLGGTGK